MGQPRDRADLVVIRDLGVRWEMEQLRSDAMHAMAVIDRMLLMDGLDSETVLHLIDLRQRFVHYALCRAYDWTLLGGDYRRIRLIDRVLALGYLKPELSYRVVRLQTRLMRELSSARLELVPLGPTDPNVPPEAHDESGSETEPPPVPAGRP